MSVSSQMQVRAKVLVYTKSYCPYCDRAKALLEQKGAAFEEIFLDDRPDDYEALKRRTGLMTVPQIFINGQLVGGFTDMAALDREGRLDALLAAAAPSTSSPADQG